MSSAEMAEWMAYARVEPFGQTRDNWHMAVLASVLVNINVGKDSKTVSPEDFMWKVKPPKPTKAELRREERKKQKAMWAQMMGWAKHNQAPEK